MTTQPRMISVVSLESAIAEIPEIFNLFTTEGVLILRGHSFSSSDHAELTSKFAEYCSYAVGATYEGGHSDDPNKVYSTSTNEYSLHWHIEKAYYVHPMYAGVWNMHHFTGTPGVGQTLFINSSNYYYSLPQDTKEFLDGCTVKWDKGVESKPDGAGPFYTRAVEISPVNGRKTLRLEVDPGCILMPELFYFMGESPSKNDKLKFDQFYTDLCYDLYDNTDIRITQTWQEGDLLFVDLFSMYHAVLSGHEFGQRKFTGVTLRGEGFNDDFYTSLDLL